MEISGLNRIVFEKAERKLLEEACDKAVEKAGIDKGVLNFYLAGDLINPITPSSFSARTLGTPYLGLFGACSTSMEGLALAAQLIDSRAAKMNALTWNMQSQCYGRKAISLSH